MPPLTRWLIRTALLYLVLALLTGVLVAAGQATRLPYPFASLAPLYYQILMVGWTTQLICGVAYWMFPISSREAPRGNRLLGWLTYGALNVGLLLQVLVETLAVIDLYSQGWLVGIAALLQFVAALAFVTNTWQRIKGH